MSKSDSRNDDVLAKARALIKPQQDVLARSFQESIKAIRWRAGAQLDWEMDRAVSGRAGIYVRDSIVLVGDSLGQVIRAKNTAFSSDSIAY